MTREEVVVVGGGAAGLASAAMLMEAGISPLVLERGTEAGAAWRTRYDRLHLHTVRWLSSLPGYRIPRTLGKWVPRDGVLDYLDQYARHHDIRVRFDTPVERIERTDGGWQVVTADGTIETGGVVVATGYSNEPVVPDWPGKDGFPGELVHSREYRNPEPYRGRSVLVVGSGNSGAEIAVDLVEGGASKVWCSVRTPPDIVRRDRFGIPSQAIGVAMTKLPSSWRRPIAGFMRRVTIPDLTELGLPVPPGGALANFATHRVIPILDVGFIDGVQTGKIEIVPAVEAFDGADVVLRGDRRIAPDAVIAATGFRPALDRILPGLDVLDERGSPRAHGGETVPGAEGLHFVGFELTLGGMLRQIAFQSRAVAAALALRRSTVAA